MRHECRYCYKVIDDGIICDDCTEERLGDIKYAIRSTLSDCVIDLLYYNRKGDEDLPIGIIELAVSKGLITVDEMIDMFSNALRKNFN